MKMMTRFLGLCALIGGMALLSGVANASLTSSFQFNGNGNWSLDGCGSNNDTPVCTIEAFVPEGSTVEVAFLYSSTWGGSATPTVNFDGTVISIWTALGLNDSGSNLQAFRADVTAQVAAIIGSGSATNFMFDILSEGPSNINIDGEVLAIIYSNPAETERTIAFLDGFTLTSGDMTSINLSEPLDTSPAGFEALLSLGIGFGFQGTGQDSEVDINGTRLTSCAGGSDDGGAFNGGLITVGGLGDSTDIPTDPNCSANGDPRQDDELYDITSLLTNGITSIVIDTRNTSSDDNIFFAGINITARAGVDMPPPPPDDDDMTPPTAMSEPGSLGLFGVGLLGLVLIRRRRMAS